MARYVLHLLFLALVGTFVAHVQVNVDDHVFICRGGDVRVKDDDCDGDMCIRLSRDLYAGAQRSTGRQRVRHDLPYVALFCVRCEVLRSFCSFLLQRLS